MCFNKESDSVVAELPFIANIPLYQKEKPYTVVTLAGSDIPPSGNVQIVRSEVVIQDVRDLNMQLSTNGFQVFKHSSNNLDAHDNTTVDRYKNETESLLQSIFSDAVCVKTWDLRKRENKDQTSHLVNLNDELRIDTPATAAHVDATFNSGPRILERHLSPDVKEQYLKPGYRFRLVNTWRPLNTVVDDCPLALCDHESIDPQDLVPTDLIYPHRHGEVYHLFYNKNQRWYWYPRQTPEDLYVFISYDSASDDCAKCLLP
ncbi:hypothetical protein ACHAPI_011424 [Fusarium lateritium]